MNPMMAQHLNEMRTSRVIFGILADSISDCSNFSVKETLENAGENFPLVKVFFTEFYLYFMACIDNSKACGHCRKGIDCINLRIHSLLNVISRKAWGNSYESRRTTSCPGEHSVLHINASYYKAEHSLEHSFFTPAILATIVNKLRKAVNDFVPQKTQNLLLFDARSESFQTITIPCFETRQPSTDGDSSPEPLHED